MLTFVLLMITSQRDVFSEREVYSTVPYIFLGKNILKKMQNKFGSSIYLSIFASLIN